MADRPPVQAVLLAAGRAERFGGGKLGQRLADGTTVLGRSVLGLLAAESGLDGDVWLVGRRDEVVPWLGPLLEEPRLHLVEVAAGGGQGDSLAAGVRALPAGSAVLVALGDQPFAGPKAVAAVLSRHRRERAWSVVAAALDGQRMPPVLFAPGLRPELERLGGDRGARDLLGRPSTAVVELGAGDWALDLDRVDELPRLGRAAAADPLLDLRSGARA